MFVLIVVYGIYLSGVNNSEVKTIGSVQFASEYQSYTFTPSSTQGSLNELKTTGGTLGSIISMYQKADSSFILYDATTTNVALRNNVATSSLRIVGVLPPTATSTTYTYDAIFTNGLVRDPNGAAATSTVTFR